MILHWDSQTGATPALRPRRWEVGGCAAIDRAVFGESRLGLGQLTEWQWEWLWSGVPEILRSGESEFGQRARSRNPWDRYCSEETSRARGGGGDGEGVRGEEES